MRIIIKKVFKVKRVEIQRVYIKKKLHEKKIIKNVIERTPQYFKRQKFTFISI
jgi:hypothetical protein